MNKKNIWCILPTILLPYMGLVVWALIMFSTQHPLLKFIMEEVFQGDAFIIVALLVLSCLILSGDKDTIKKYVALSEEHRLGYRAAANIRERGKL